MAAGLSTAEQRKQKDALARLARMKQALQLTEFQERAIGEVMTKYIQRGSQAASDMLLGKLKPEQWWAQAGDKASKEAEIRALLTPEQLAAYPEFQQAEATLGADRSASSDATQIAKDFGLPPAQQERVRSLFYEMYLREPSNGLNEAGLPQANQQGSSAHVLSMQIELQKSQLEEKAMLLEGVLSPEQLAAYRRSQMARINRLEEGLRAFLPDNPAGVMN